MNPSPPAASSREHGQRRVLGRLVDRDRQIAAGAAPELVRPPRARHGAHGRHDAVAHRAADLEPALGGHGSNGSSWLKTIPSRIFGKKNVDLGGMVCPASATASTSATARRRHEQGDGRARRRGGDERGGRLGALAVGDAIGRRDRLGVEAEDVARARASRPRRRRAPCRRRRAGGASSGGCAVARARARTKGASRRRRGDAPLERVDVGDLLELPALGQQLGQALPQLRARAPLTTRCVGNSTSPGSWRLARYTGAKS